MKTLIVYDSTYGNTEEIARAIGRGIGDEAQVVRVDDAQPERLTEYDLVIAGAPTQGGRPSPKLNAFLRLIPAYGLNDVWVTAFDTRIEAAAQGFMLRTFMGFLGYAAGRIARELEKKGGRLTTDPRGFLVVGKEGPLAAGELDRAGAWGSTIAHAFAASA